MKKKISVLALSLCAMGSAWGQQLPNVGFNDWRSSNGTTTTTYGGLGSFSRPGDDPAEWNGSNVTQVLDFDGLTTKATETVNGVSNTYVKLTNVACGAVGVTSNAPGFISIATPWVFAVTDILSAKSCLKYGDGGTYGGASFTYRPDAISVRYRHTAVNSEKAHVIAYLWNGTFTSKVNKNCKYIKFKWQVSEYLDLNDVDRAVMGKESSSNVSAKGNLIASVDYEITDNESHWDEPVIIPINYNNTTDIPEKMNVIICSGDYWTRSNLQEGSTMDVDDVQFVYYKTLSALSVNNAAVTLEDGVYEYDVKGTYSEGCISATTTSPFASYQVGTYDATNHSVTLTVTANDGNTQDYTINFVPDAATIDNTYKSQIEVAMDGSTYSFNDVTLKANDDNTMNFILKGFAFGGKEIGNVNVENVPIAWGSDDNITLSCSKNIDVVVTNPEAENWGLTDLPMELNATVNPTTKELKAELTITWNEMPINVTVVPQPITYTIDENNNVKVTSGTLDDIALETLLALVQDVYVPSFDFRGATVTASLGDLIDDFPNAPVYVDANCDVDGAEKAIKNGVVSGTYTFTDQYDAGDTTPSLYIPEDFTAASISYPREFNITDGYASTFILPFGFNVPEGVTIAKLSKVENGNKLVFTEVTKTEAHTPYVVVTDKNNFVDDLTNVAVKKTVGADLTVEVDGVKHIGSYSTQSVSNVYGYSEGKFVKAKSGTVKPFRTYIQVNTSAGAAPKAFQMEIENPTTGIRRTFTEAAASSEAAAPAYNLQGIRVNSLAKGVYIVGGKKVIR